MSEGHEVELFGNDDWSLSPEGLEHRRTGYVIDRAVLAARRAERLWDWPLQMAEKRWCRPSLFREAFLAALDRFGIDRDAELARSFALGFGLRASADPTVAGFRSLGEVLRPRETEAPVPARRTARGLAVSA